MKTKQLRQNIPAKHLPKGVLEESIRRRAYEIYEARNREDGHDLDHWLEAEAEVSSERARRTVA